ncbi:ABC transporter ATP-binding protein [Labrys wisconsinensis]|uniref:Spermidine/putrescine import ATP-binding protein PotA n=1 Tax=Labrys wisconsinensis TaxID=425677 RepID=A0ABU0J971_9HYPH|nr:ABC transporter ATP-binding protein [Labrys wisconsinensis]MDQ0469814.1 putative spermidine/putrescine transport system ATP-binding protein [Labrys wisconsinensis]
MNAIPQSGARTELSTPIVSFRGVSRSYDGRTPVVDGLDLDIRAGEFLTLLGPSGSGKTTTLMMLAGFEWPDRGEIRLNGRDITRLPAYGREMGVVFQSYALFPHMSVAENIAFPLGVRKMPRAEQARLVEQALALVHLAGLGGRKPQQLSGGQQQRVALARALVYRPRLVLMDEPLGALDKALRESMQAELKQIHRQLGITFVYVTHDQDEALTMSDRVAVFHQGRIAQIAAPETLYRRPASRFVAGFVGETNLIEGTVTALDQDRARLRLPNGAMVEGWRSEGLAEGGAAVLAVRPEAVALRPAGGGTIDGIVADAAFHGDHLRLQVEAEGTAVQVKIGAAAGVVVPRRLERVGLALPAEDCVVLA